MSDEDALGKIIADAINETNAPLRRRIEQLLEVTVQLETRIAQLEEARAPTTAKLRVVNE